METEPKTPSSSPAPVSPPAPTKSRSAFHWKIIAVILVVIAGCILVGRQSSHGKSLPATDTDTLVTVPVVKAARQDLVRSESFDAEFRPYQVIDLHADVAGFVQSINVDIGDRVKKGDLLATLQIPELSEEIERAAATKIRDEKIVEQANASYADTHLTWTRLTKISHNRPHLVAQQDLDTAQAKDSAADAALAAAKEDVNVAQAELDKLKAIQSDCHIIAPFEGVVTKRYADVGALVQGGVSPSGAAMPLVRLSENERLRLDFPVSISYVHSIKTGDPVEIKISATGQMIHGKISRFTRNVDMDTRTMETEVDVPNPDLSLTPGIYAEARLEFERRSHALTVPANALSDLKHPTAFVVNHDDVVEERPLTLGLTMPDKFEVLSGLGDGDLVVLGNRSQIKPGQKVDPKLMDTASLQ